jgi:hypothetical protein
MKWIAVASLLLLSLPLSLALASPAQAGTNFPAVNDYPPPNCAKPGSAPVLQSGARGHGFTGLTSDTSPDPDAVAEYNERLARYNAAQLAYRACINAYVANAGLDLNMVRSKAGKPVPNFPALKDYPTPDCGDPVEVPRTEGGTMDSLGQRTSDYNAGMARYNKYIACMNAYMANVQADANVIQGRVNKAIADSNP